MIEVELDSLDKHTSNALNSSFSAKHFVPNLDIGAERFLLERELARLLTVLELFSAQQPRVFMIERKECVRELTVL